MATKAPISEKSIVRKKRSEWEGFELTLLSAYTVLVRNVSHDDPEGHEYVVSVVDGEATCCTCPDAKYRHKHCKHQYKVENEPTVLMALGGGQ